MMSITDLNFGPDGIYDWEFIDTNGAPGTEWDFLSVDDQLSVTATDIEPFKINILGTNFDPESSHSWPIVTALGINGFSANKFLLDTSTNVSNPFSGTFSVAQSGNSLNIVYTAAAIPEPAVFGMFGVAGGIVLLMRCRNSCS